MAAKSCCIDFMFLGPPPGCWTRYSRSIMLVTIANSSHPVKEPYHRSDSIEDTDYTATQISCFYDKKILKRQFSKHINFVSFGKSWSQNLRYCHRKYEIQEKGMMQCSQYLALNPTFAYVMHMILHTVFIVFVDLKIGCETSKQRCSKTSGRKIFYSSVPCRL